jgi:hypothetical protein
MIAMMLLPPLSIVVIVLVVVLVLAGGSVVGGSTQRDECLRLVSTSIQFVICSSTSWLLATIFPKHTYPSGTTTSKAFVANNFVVYNKASLDEASSVNITWRTKKTPEQPRNHACH